MLKQIFFKKARLLGVCLMVLIACKAHATILADNYKGKAFWLAWLQSETGPDAFELSLTITSETETTVTLKLSGVKADSRGEKDWEETYTVKPGVPTEIIIPEPYTIKTKTGKTTNKGLYIEADEDIMVVARNSSGSSSDAAVIIPVKSLGSEYYTLQYSVIKKDYPSQYIVLATEDSTVVDIMNTVKNTDGATPYTLKTIVLNKGDYHSVQSDKDLTGTWIKERNGKKIAVFSGNTCAYVPLDCQSCDHLFEQMLPTNSWGHEFAVINFDRRDRYVLRILAKEDKTWVDIDGVRHEIAKAGKFLELQYTDPVYITASRNVLVCQYTIGTRCDDNRGDPSMVMVKPLLAYSGVTYLPVLATKNIGRFYLTLTFKSEDVDKITVNGEPITDKYKPLAYSSSYSYAHIELQDAGNYIDCDCKYNFFSYGLGWYESYAY